MENKTELTEGLSSALESLSSLISRYFFFFVFPDHDEDITNIIQQISDIQNHYPDHNFHNWLFLRAENFASGYNDLELEQLNLLLKPIRSHALKHNDQIIISFHFLLHSYFEILFAELCERKDEYDKTPTPLSDKKEKEIIAFTRAYSYSFNLKNELIAFVEKYENSYREYMNLGKYFREGQITPDVPGRGFSDCRYWMVKLAAKLGVSISHSDFL